MLLYIIYKDAKELIMKDDKLPEHTVSMPKLNEIRAAPQVPEEMSIVNKEEETREVEEMAGKEEKKMAEGQDGIEMSPV